MQKVLILLAFLGLYGLQMNAQPLKADNMVHFLSFDNHRSWDVAFSVNSEFMVATETWYTSCGKNDGRIYVYIDGGVLLYHVVIIKNQTGQKILDIWTSQSKVEVLNLIPGTYKVIVDDSNTPVPNNYTLFAAEIKNSSSPVLSIASKSNESCNDAKGSIQATAQSGVGPYKFKNLTTGEENFTGKFENLKTKTYEIQVSDANFCTDVESVLILNVCDPIFSKTILQKHTCDSLKSLKLDTVKSGKASGTNTDSFTIVKYNFSSKKVSYIYETTCDVAKVGTFFVKKDTSIYGCDSLLTYRVITYSPDGDRILENATTSCISYKSKIDTFIGKNIHGCDSVHFTVWLYEGLRIRYVGTRDTCIASPDHIDTVKSLLCASSDSIHYVTHFRVLPKDTVRIAESWCRPKKPDTTYFPNQFGCESMKIISYLVKPLDTTFVNLKTCDPGLAGKKVFNLITRDSLCDSVVVETTILTKKLDTAKLTFYVCGLKKPVHKEMRLQNSLGCLDSLVIIDSLVANSIVIQLPLTRTCDKTLSGNFIDTLATIHGCDSIIKWSVAYVAPTRKVNTSYVCDKSQAGVFPHYFTNQYGCDSTIIDSVIYAGSTPLPLPDSVICGSKKSETMLTQNLKNQYGCDSVVKQKLITLESPVLHIDGYNHPTSKWNGSIDLSVTKGKGPWTLYDGQGNEVPWESYDKKGGLYPFVVVDANGCWDSIAVALSDFWAYTLGRVIHLHGGLADDELVNDYYGGEEVMVEVYDGQSLLETRRIQNIRLEFDITFPKLTTAGVYYFRMVFPNQPKHYLVTKAVIQ